MTLHLSHQGRNSKQNRRQLNKKRCQKRRSLRWLWKKWTKTWWTWRAFGCNRMARLAWGKTLVAAIRQLFSGKFRTRHLRDSHLNKKRALMLSKKQLQLQMPSWSRWQKWNGSRLIRVAVSNTSTIRRYRPLRVSICQNGAFRTLWRKIKTF